MGNAVAVSYALYQPERVRGLVLAAWYELDGYPLLEQRRKAHRMSFAELHLKMSEIRRTEGQQALLDFIEREAEVLFPIFPQEPALRSRMAHMVASHPEGHYVQALEHLTSVPNLVPEVHRIHCPILGICGANDPSPDRPELLAHVPNFTQAWIEGARRFTVMERPEEFNRIAGEFLDTLAASGTPAQ
jgi:pimeloyl-ACP methyl ester carboxylesterase